MEASKQKFLLEIPTQDLGEQQLRLFKQLSYLMLEVSLAETEKHYFESSSELLRLCASVILQGKFPLTKSQNKNSPDAIPYALQSLEYSMDMLTEFLEQSKIISFDN